MNAPFLARTLRSYQQRAATFLYERDAAFLIAPLGAGKGAAALTALADLVRDRHRRHALVIAPKLVATTVWPAEIASWCHLAHLRIAVLDGGPERRRALLATADAREVTVIGVDLVPWLVRELAAFADDHPLFDVLIVDETSRLKDPSGKRARALLKVAGRFRTRWGLTGTPRPNSSRDLFTPAAIITNGALWGRAFLPWQKRHFRPRDPFGREWVALPGVEAKIAADFGTVAMTVADADMPDLPPINVVVTPLKLPDAVMASYRTMQRELFAAVKDRTIEAASALIATGKLAQMANGFVYGEEGAEDAVPVHDLKIEWLRELVESLEGEPLLVAYEFVEDLRTIPQAFGEVPALGGPTSAREAARLIAAWNAGALPLLAFHPASAGHGLNLQFGGSRMAWLSPSWSAELTQQAIARIYRPGQTQHVTIHVCVATGTVDEMKRDRVIGKMSAQEAFRRHLERI
jgi:SNF2 family DNA or RNA helicase